MSTQGKPRRFLVRGANDPVGDEREIRAWSPEEAACNYIAWSNNCAAEYPDERTAVVTGPDGRTVAVLVTLHSVPQYSGKVTEELP